MSMKFKSMEDVEENAMILQDLLNRAASLNQGG